ncbi:MAG: chromosome segregation protein SMC [Hyphomicrobiaceae bacterium]|nr:chromosome segregation protein SMC [Hyphomicrobiaceae bacterium]
MHITRLRLIGFKSFVEPTELLIERGLTGVVGPNGCGKSNLLEALRWVMGETSHKSMRASAMDDVIFSGTSGRPARNMAEVTILVDNSRRNAPAEFNDDDTIEITRRIEREQGSAYRVNARDVRARDVKILFEDAATGARSPALVRQGQIGEIVNAKPEQRRRILEDAAGIAGLHSRRHEAELRLKAAENNLARIGDILGQLKSQLDTLKRQARQARRYEELSAEMRRLEAIQMYLTWRQAQTEVDRDEQALGEALNALGIATREEAEAIRTEAEAAEALPARREAEMVRAAVVARLNNEVTSLEREAERARARCAELDRQIEASGLDIERERSLVAEAGELQTRLRQSLAALLASDEGDGERETRLHANLASWQSECETRETALTAATQALLQARAERNTLDTRLREITAQRDRLDTRSRQLAEQQRAVAAAAPDASRQRATGERVAALTQEINDLGSRITDAEARAAVTEQTSRDARTARDDAALALKALTTEIGALERLLAQPDQSAPSDTHALLDDIDVEPGFETALGAALGDDIEASTATEAARHWNTVAPHPGDPALPAGVQPLTAHSKAPKALQRRLAQIGLVDPADALALQMRLATGQCLVSREGDLWRWDGFVARSGAPTPAAQRLAMRNQLRLLHKKQTHTEDLAARTATAFEHATAQAQAAKSKEHDLRARLREAQDANLTATRELASLEKAASETESRLAALAETIAAVEAERTETATSLAEAQSMRAHLGTLDDLEAREQQARAEASQSREALATTRAELASLERERNHRQAQRAALDSDLSRWAKRAAEGAQQIIALEQRLATANAERATVAGVPEETLAKRDRLENERARAEAERRAAADTVATAETAHRDATTRLKSASETVSQCREERARADARLEGARMKRQGISQHIRDTLDTSPDGCLERAGIAPDAATELPGLSAVEAQIARLRTDRDRLGGVNLDAENELRAIEEQYGGLDSERADVDAAIQKLRGGIASLNREGRKRLREAFDRVDGHFRELFTTLFGGGEARLEMVEDNEDPLAGGLEIIARPPGKKPTSLSLLSGGEQTLTALSLIFAVFLTNPSPICVLDEVDAPLDDANVDRFCTLMEKMAGDTETRFLVITHHPMTMARMDRLFGVTMVEKGVSQLVSVDLSIAEKMVEAV